LKVVYVTHNLHSGGAANYAKRVISCNKTVLEDYEVYVGSLGKSGLHEYLLGATTHVTLNRLRSKVANICDRGLQKLGRGNGYRHRSLNLVGALSAKTINANSADLVDIFWIGHGLISLGQLEKINKPIVWHCLDMWPFVSSEHYVSEKEDRAFGEYKKEYMNRDKFRLDFDLLVYELKKKLNQKNITYIHPSDWSRKSSLQSELTSHANHFVIPPPIDLNHFHFKDSQLKTNDPSSPLVIGFGGGFSGRKGWLQAKEIFFRLRSLGRNFEFVHFGAKEPDKDLVPFPNYIFRGLFYEGDETFVDLLNYLDLLLFPSLYDAYGLLGQEAQACGTLIAVRRDTGAESIISEGVTGFSFVNSDELLAKIITLMGVSRSEFMEMKLRTRLWAEKSWNCEKVAGLTLDVYKQVLR
jgi:glycosyltransferase involved in cell wall biosynthesis